MVEERNSSERGSINLFLDSGMYFSFGVLGFREREPSWSWVGRTNGQSRKAKKKKGGARFKLQGVFLVGGFGESCLLACVMSSVACVPCARIVVEQRDPSLGLKGELGVRGRDNSLLNSDLSLENLVGHNAGGDRGLFKNLGLDHRFLGDRLQDNSGGSLGSGARRLNVDHLASAQDLVVLIKTGANLDCKED